MKKLILIIVLFYASRLSAEWMQYGNAERITPSNTSISKFVVSLDTRYIYTLDTSNTIIKWNFATGDTIWSKKITPALSNYYLNSWLSISSDGRTYCEFFVFPPVDGNNSSYIFIYDIETDILIDSINITLSYTREYYCNDDPIYCQADYNSLNRKLIAYVNKVYSFWGPWYEGAEEGDFFVYSKQDTNWIKRNYVNMTTNSVAANFDCSKYYFNYTKGDYYYIGHSDPSESSSDYNANNYYDVFADIMKAITYYYYYHSSSASGSSQTTEQGVSYPFSSFFFDNSGENMYFALNNKIYKYNFVTNTTLNQFTSNFAMPEYPSNATLKISNTKNDNFFFTITDNKLNYHSLQNYCYVYTYTLNAVTKLNQYKCSPDMNYFLFSDNYGKLYRISFNDLEPLKSAFTQSDTLVMVEDTISFIDASLGSPTEYLWDFGDGTYSTEANPKKVYDTSGYFNVTLIVRKNGIADTLIKNNLVHVLPFFNADFTYTMSGTNPVTVTFTPTNADFADTFLWALGDSTTSTEKQPQHEYSLSGQYLVTLNVTYKGITKTSSQTLIIDVPEQALNCPTLLYEYTMPDSNAFATAAYEDLPNKIAYHVLQDAEYKWGMMDNFNTQWEQSQNNILSYFVRRQPLTYSIVSNGYLANYDLYGNKYLEKNFYCDDLYYAKANEDLINFIYRVFSGKYCYYILSYNINNEIFDTVLVSCSDYNPSYPVELTEISTKYFYALRDSLCTDYILNYKEVTKYQNSYYTTNHLCFNNGNNLQDKNYIDMMRLNDTVLVLTYKNGLTILRNRGIRPKEGISDATWNVLVDSVYEGCQFKQMLRLNDTSFFACGSKNGSPAYFLINLKGEIVKEVALSERTGFFNSIAYTYNYNLILSGYRYKYFGIKQPYFFSAFDVAAIFGRTDLVYNTKKDSIIKPPDTIIVNPPTASDGNPPRITLHPPIEPEIFGLEPTLNMSPDSNPIVYPNPTSSIARICFYNPMHYNVKASLYDNNGNLVDRVTKRCDAGINTIDFDLRPLSSGTFYFSLETINKFQTGMIVYIND